MARSHGPLTVGRLGRLGLVALVGLAGALALGACSDGRLPSTTPTFGRPSTTTPPPGGASGFVAFGDFGGGPKQYDVARAMSRWAEAGHRVDALVTTGDNVYPRGEPELFDAHLRRPYADLTADRPLWATLGNHDIASERGSDQLAYLGLPELPYARSLPGVEILLLDANRPDAAQAAWLDERLRAPGPRFRVVVFHQPAFSCGPHGPTAGVVREWVPVLEAHRVALVLQGHDHLYERFVSDGGVTYVVTGGGGRDLYRSSERCDLAAERRAAARRHHFVAVEVDGGTMYVTAVADDGSVVDETTVRR
jgi:hypothetical protein